MRRPRKKTTVTALRFLHLVSHRDADCQRQAAGHNRIAPIETGRFVKDVHRNPRPLQQPVTLPNISAMIARAGTAQECVRMFAIRCNNRVFGL
ncbi:MAG: hypothetical protein U1F40_00615 [Turneriella sp.]